MAESSINIDGHQQKNPKLALLRKLKEQKEQVLEEISIEKTFVPVKNKFESTPIKEQCFQIISKKKPNEIMTRPKVGINNPMPHISGTFLDEFEKSIKISENETQSARLKIDRDKEMNPSAISLNDIKNYIDDLSKPTRLISLPQKQSHLQSRLLLIQELSKSHSRNLLTGKHMYNIGIASLMPKNKCDIYEATAQIIDDFYRCFDKEKTRVILLDFMTFFSNVLTSKDIGMTTYVIEQSIKTGVLERLLKMAVDWTTSDNNILDLPKYETYPSNITAQIENYLRDKEDQLTATWKPLTQEDTSKCMLPTLERCLNSTVRFGDNTDMELYELSVLDHSASGLQPNTAEGKVHPITATLAEKFPSFFDKYKSSNNVKENDKALENQQSTGTNSGVISFHRLFNNGYAFASLGMKRRKYLEKLDEISDSIAEVLASHPNVDFGTISMYSSNEEHSSPELPDLESLQNEEMNVDSTKLNERLRSKKSGMKNIFIVMTEDLHFNSTNSENQQNVPKYLVQIDFLRAIMLKPKNIQDTYRGLKSNGGYKNKLAEWAYVYLVDVGLTAQVRVTSLITIKNKSILTKEALLSFVKIKELDPSIDLEVANACARVIFHIIDDSDSHRLMAKYIIKGEVIRPPSISSWKRLLVEKNHSLGLQALSIKAFRCISQEHHDKNCSNLDEMPVNDSEFHTDMCKYIGEFIWKLLYVKSVDSSYEKITQDQSIADAMYTLYYTMDIMPEARLKRTLEESKIGQVIQVMQDPQAIISKAEPSLKINELVDSRKSAPIRRQLDDMVLSLAEKINAFEHSGNALMRRITNQRLTSRNQPGSRRSIGHGNAFNDMGPRQISNRAPNRGLTGNPGSKRRTMPSESEGGPIQTGGGIVPNSRSQAHQIALKAGIPGFNQPVYRSKADIDPEVRYSTVGQSGVSTKAIAYRTAEDKYIEDLENAPANCAIVMKEKTPIIDRAKELERIQQDEDPIDYEALITYADIADFALPENVVALPDMKSSRRFKQEIVALLNESRGGQILMGVDERLNGGAGLVNGVFLSRFLKDKFRQEMDGIPKQIAPDPLPDRRIGQPVFIPVRYNPRALNRNGETPYVIRIAIRPKIKEQSPKSSGDSAAENQIFYKLRDEPNPMIRLNGKTVEGTFQNIQKKILQRES